MGVSGGMVALLSGSAPGAALPAEGQAIASRAASEHEFTGDPLVVLLLGPTGSGKTALSLELAESFGGEIVSCVSAALYCGMDVGIAKPTV